MQATAAAVSATGRFAAPLAALFALLPEAPAS
jgi:hypothetical protein